MNRLPSFLLFAVLVIPTEKMDGWRTEKFSNIPNNEVSASTKGLLIRVRKSASPLLFPLKSVEKVIGFKISGEFRGLPSFYDVSKQGQKESDDYPLRVGIIVPGEKRLSGIRKLFASEWVRHIFSLVPNRLGLSHVHFFNVTQNSSQVGKSREHPASDLVKEEFIASVKKAGPFVYEYQLKQPLEAAAIWISIDGDDTQSEYEVLISTLEFTTVHGSETRP